MPQSEDKQCFVGISCLQAKVTWVDFGLCCLYPLVFLFPTTITLFYHECVCVIVIGFASFYGFSIGYWNCSEIVVIFAILLLLQSLNLIVCLHDDGYSW